MIEYYKNLSLENLFYTDENGVLQEEEWRDVPEYIKMYQISTFSRVKSLSRPMVKGKVKYISKDRILKQNGDSLAIKFSNGKGEATEFKIHKLMIWVFFGIKLVGYEKIIDHRDNNHKNNVLSNLQIITQRKNTSKDKNFETKSSKYTGVCWNKVAKKWQANIHLIKGASGSHLYQTDDEYTASLFYETAVNNLDKFDGDIEKFRRLIKDILNINYNHWSKFPFANINVGDSFLANAEQKTKLSCNQLSSRLHFNARKYREETNSVSIFSLKIENKYSIRVTRVN